MITQQQIIKPTSFWRNPVEWLKNASNEKQAKRSFLSWIQNELVDTTKKTIKKWRNSELVALDPECPRRYLLIDVYEDAMKDPHLTSVVTTRNLKVLGRKFKLVHKDTQEEDRDKTRLFRTRWFRKYLQEILNAKFFGHTLLYFPVPVNGVFKEAPELIPRTHVVPEHNLVLKHVSDPTGIDYTKPPFDKWVLEAGEKRDIGILNKAVPHVIMKRSARVAWSEYGHIFGMPIRTATTSKNDTTLIRKVESILQKMGKAAWAVMPEGTSLDLKESGNRDAFNVFDKQQDRDNSEISKLIFGQTMTTEDGSSRSQAEVHENVANDYTKDDSLDAQLYINDELIPFMTMHGYDLENYEFEWDDTREISKETRIKIDEAISRMGYTPEKEYLENTYDIVLEAIEKDLSKGGTEAKTAKELLNQLQKEIEDLYV